jgi:hypothetical protein
LGSRCDVSACSASCFWHRRIVGTGKFEGVKGGGTTTPLAQMPDGRSAIAWEGSWALK